MSTLAISIAGGLFTGIGVCVCACVRACVVCMCCVHACACTRMIMMLLTYFYFVGVIVRFLPAFQPTSAKDFYDDDPYWEVYM